MCIEVQISYPRCSHVHRGYELCPDISSKQNHCSNVLTQPRTEPFCPQCAKLEYRANRLRSARERRAQQLPQLISHMDTTTDGRQSWVLRQCPPPARQEFGDCRQMTADYFNRSNFDRSILEPPSQITKSYGYLPPPSPLEPPIDPRTSGPRQFLEYRQKATLVVGSGYARR